MPTQRLGSSSAAYWPRYLCFALLTATALASESATRWETLSAEQQASVRQGGLVTVEEEVAGGVWPRIILFLKVAATPEQVTAVFTDYASSVDFIPNVKVSRVELERSRRTSEVYYELALPLLPNERYTAINTVVQTGPDAYQVSWQVPKGRFFKTSRGSLTVTSLAGGALMRYENLVDPGAKIAKLLKQRAVHQAEETLQAIAGQVEKLKNENAAKLAELVEELRADLAATR